MDSASSRLRPQSSVEPPEFRILIAMSDAGGGHRRLSEALGSGVQAVAGSRAEVRIQDLFALDRSSWPFRLQRLYGPTIRIAPWLYGLVYAATDGRARVNHLVRRGDDRLLPTARDLVRHFQPDVVVTTHPLVNGLILDALRAEGSAAPVMAQVSELATVHASWVEPRIAGYAAATEEVRAALLRRGAQAAAVRVLGLPVGPDFGRATDGPGAIRHNLGLDRDRFTVLALGGGEGAGGLRMAVAALLESGLDIQLIVVCGRNTALRRRLQSLSAPFPMRVLGYVDEVARLMAAADVVLTKGGPQSISEALASGKPVLVTSCLPGQERGNDRLVEGWGVGYHVPTPARVVAAVARLALDESARTSAIEAVARHARPEAASRVAEWALALAAAPSVAPNA